MLTHHGFVFRKVDAEGLVGGDEGLHPLHFARKLGDRGIGSRRQAPEFLARETADFRDVALDQISFHRSVLQCCSSSGSYVARRCTYLAITRRAARARDSFNASMNRAKTVVRISGRPAVAGRPWSYVTASMRSFLSETGFRLRSGASSFHDDDFEILARHDHRAIIRLVHAGDQTVEIFFERVLLSNVEGRKRL